MASNMPDLDEEFTSIVEHVMTVDPMVLDSVTLEENENTNKKELVLKANPGVEEINFKQYVRVAVEDESSNREYTISFDGTTATVSPK